MAPKAEKKPVGKKPAEEKKAAEKGPTEKKPKAGKKLPKEAGAGVEKKKKRSKKSVETYKIYIFKVLKQVHPDIEILSKAMGRHSRFLTASRTAGFFQVPWPLCFFDDVHPSSLGPFQFLLNLLLHD